MLFKLSMSGLKNKRKDYIVLLAGLVMSISIFYMFQTLALNKAFIEANSVINSIQFVFHAGSFLLAIITFFYILYANSFLLSLRQKEFGMYMMLGAKKQKITSLMFIETIVIGFISLLLGIALGISLAKGIGQLLMKQLEFSAGGYHAFYLPSMAVTCVFFLFLFILSALLNGIKLSRITVLQLVHSDNQAERAFLKGKRTAIIAFLSIILLAIGYAAMVNMEDLKEIGMIVALVTITSGTYLIFMSLLPLIIKKMKENKKRTEKKINVFTFAQLNFRINSLTKILATVAMLVALGAGAISAGMAFKNNIMLMVNGFEIYDVVTHNPTAEEKDLLANITFNEKEEYHYKINDQFVYYIKEELEKNRPFIQDYSDRSSFGKHKRVSGELPAGAVANAEQGTDHILVPDGWESALNTIQPYYVYPDHSIKIVDSNSFDKIQGKEGNVFVGISDDFEAYKAEWKKLDILQQNKYNDKSSFINSKYRSYQEFYGVASGTVFMGFFLGIAFLAMMASCLMFKILSGASKDINRYQMLQKIGIRYNLLTKSIYKELFLVFLFPAIIGIAHVLVGMNMFSFILIDPYFRVWLPICIFIFIYAVYYMITVQLYKGIVLPKTE